MATVLVDHVTGYGETVAYKAPCRLATTASISLSGLQTIDGVVTVADDRILVKNQSTASQNGIYIASAGTWQRARDMDSNRDVTKGTRVTVTDGSANAGREYQVSTANPIAVGTTALTFAETLSSDAGASADAAAASATAAAGSATAAAASATSASGSATTATTQATAAASSATSAAASATTATTQATNASTSASGAATSATNAGNSATAAAGSATSASTSATAAAAWAEEDEDVEVLPGMYSAKHWAAKSLESASDVTSVNGQSGTVVLGAADVGAQPADADLTSWAGVARAAGFDEFAATPSSDNLRSMLTDETGTGAAVFATAPTIANPTFEGTATEDVYTITDGAGFAIDPRNGSIQRVVLGANRTPTAANFANGDSVTLLIDDGTARTITWSTIGVVWKGGTAPTLATTGFTEINITREGNVYRGVHVGDFAS